MDQLNSFMSEQNFGKPLKTKVRAFFNQTRDVAKVSERSGGGGEKDEKYTSHYYLT